MDIAELDRMLAGAARPVKEVPLCLRGALQAEWEALDLQLKQADEAGTATLAGSPEMVATATRMRAIEAEMRDNTVTAKLQAMTRGDFKLFMAEHPPREGNDDDKLLGYNGETIWDDLVRRSIIEPRLDGEHLTALLDALTARQFDNLANTAWALNRQDVAVPFSATASRIAASSGGTLRQPSA